MRERLTLSLKYSLSIIGIVSSIISVVGFSLLDISWLKSWFIALLIVFACWVLIFLAIFVGIGYKYRKSVSLEINGTRVLIYYGDIFQSPGIRVIQCDSHFDTCIDDIHIQRDSLHGQLFRKINNNKKINDAVRRRAAELKLSKNKKGLYSFPLGTVIRYEDCKENQVYLMLALTRLNSANKAITSWNEYEQTLAMMWSEIDACYACHDVSLPLLGSGITRFDSVVKKEELLECMLRSFKKSGITFKSTLNIVLHESKKNTTEKPIQLYKFKYMFH